MESADILLETPGEVNGKTIKRRPEPYGVVWKVGRRSILFE
jgi:hypothetical protein